MIILYLLFAHLVSDFLLQTNKLISLKHKNWQGTFFHMIVHFALSMLVLLPYMPNMNVLLVVVFIAITHFFIDLIKIVLERKTKKYMTLFIFDQAIHIAILVFGGYLLLNAKLTVLPEDAVTNAIVWLYTDFSVVVALCLAIIVTFFYDLMLFQLGWNPRAVYKPDYRRFALRILFWGALYGVFLVFWNGQLL